MLRMILLKGKLDMLCLAVQYTRSGEMTDRQAHVITVLSWEITGMLERQVADECAELVGPAAVATTGVGGVDAELGPSGLPE
ncbi:hypothetical protein LTR36_004929 [Oleoguttula mirabilis]|uniref:Uncharacterized protein n=1 Tax=Oleoguttula mirabilis TaxID=1507867 RepID=A0AAV9JWY6_9PEZI|nr:hypothetical protein LTR36_004929 [Oleoguttula mirabilis]